LDDSEGRGKPEESAFRLQHFEKRWNGSARGWAQLAQRFAARLGNHGIGGFEPAG
jgi:hypothetical protein